MSVVVFTLLGTKEGLKFARRHDVRIEEINRSWWRLYPSLFKVTHTSAQIYGDGRIGDAPNIEEIKEFSNRNMAFDFARSLVGKEVTTRDDFDWHVQRVGEWC